ncbi:MAG: hypothetical protein RLZZ196_643 [Bacteroidota bacterium]|jgi:hypothetical protein
MKKLLFLLLFPTLSFAQCIKVDSIYVTAKVRELGNRNIKFGIKQIMQEELLNRFCLSDSGKQMNLEVYYFGLPKTTLRIAGVERTEQITQVGVKIYYNGEVYQGIGESNTEIKTIMIEVKEGSLPFEKMTVSSCLKKAIKYAVEKIP